MFDQQMDVVGEIEMCLNFVGQAPVKRARTFSRNFSRSPTERSTSSASTASRYFIAHELQAIPKGRMSPERGARAKSPRLSFREDLFANPGVPKGLISPNCLAASFPIPLSWNRVLCRN
jgi:hypothetical protein